MGFGYGLRYREADRNKVDSPGGPSLIQTVRGAGYRFNPTPTS
jgi:DNA-binding response OmpR family regulator